MSLLTVRDLSILAPAGPIVSGLSFSVSGGRILGVIGESGSGKSMTVKAIAGLLPGGLRTEGSIRFEDTELTTLSRKAYRGFRDRELGIVYQEPRAHVNPVHSVGDFLVEALRVNRRMGKEEAFERVAQACRDVGIADPESQLRAYPHQFSGGMLQRAVIAAAIVTEPRLLLADEPTTAVDVTRQAEIAALLRALVRERGVGMLFITHDLELAGAICDEVLVMYRGRCVESFPAEQLFEATHPYTRALLAARPSMTGGSSRLPVIDDELRRRLEEEVAGE